VRVDAARFIPVGVAFGGDPSRAEIWGRLLSLSPDGATLVSHAPVPDGALLLLQFEIFGDAFHGVEALVTGVETDADGYAKASLQFRKTADRVAIGRAVRRVVASQLPDTR